MCQVVHHQLNHYCMEFTITKKIDAKVRKKDKFYMNLNELNKLINSELTSKIIKSEIENDEIKINIDVENLFSTLSFLKTDEKCKFKQLIDIVAVDYPNSEKRFKIYYLLLSHEKNIRCKIFIEFNIEYKIPSITKLYPSANWMERKFLICMVSNLKIILI